MLLLRWLDGLGGTVNFSFFQAEPWVDLKLPPGTTPQQDSSPQFWPTITASYIIYSPNLIWLMISILVYVLAPYDDNDDDDDILSPDEHQWKSRAWLIRRAILNVTLVVTYYGYWHVALYGFHWAKRPFVQGRKYRISKLIHDVWYCVLGTLQWTAWEYIMVHLYKTGRIGYQTNAEAFGTLPGLLINVACTVIIPIFREVHFFFSHKLIHTRCLYKYIHAIHHRNSDPEPFSGLCMSVAEHIYYISCMAPSIYWRASPFQFLWNGLHMLISPGASHSGWEDHWAADQHHTAHHLYFECNYGTPSIPLDRWFGTFRETLAPQSKHYRGDAITQQSTDNSGNSSSSATNNNNNNNNQKKKNDTKYDLVAVVKARDDSKATLWGLPPWDQMMYNTATAMGLPLWVYLAVLHRDDDSGDNVGEVPWVFQPAVVALGVSIGPLVLAAILTIATTSNYSSWEKFQYNMLYPFHKEAVLGRYGITLLFATIFSLMPTYHFFHALLVRNPEDSIFHRIRA